MDFVLNHPLDYRWRRYSLEYHLSFFSRRLDDEAPEVEDPAGYSEFAGYVLDILESDGHAPFADYSPLLDEPEIREIETVEFPVQAKDEAEEKEHEEDKDVTGEFEARNHRAYKRAGEDEVEKKEKRYSGQRQRQKEPVRVDPEDERFIV